VVLAIPNVYQLQHATDWMQNAGFMEVLKLNNPQIASVVYSLCKFNFKPQ
jgi:hypothetical protein